MKKQPRKHQSLCLEAMWTSLNKSPDPILLDLTVGFGKSLICAWVAETLQNAGRTNLILTMTSDLVDQNSKEFMAIGDKPYEPSILCSKLGLNTWKRPVLFATPQSLWAKVKSGHPVGARHFDMITVDECFSGDTMIKTSDGEFRIDDPALIDKEILCFCEVTHKVYYHKPVRVLHNGVRFTSQIKTKHGEVKCTSTHLFFTGESWVKAKSLRAGQRIALDGSSDFVLIKVIRAAVAVAKELFRSVQKATQHYISKFHRL